MNTQQNKMLALPDKRTPLKLNQDGTAQGVVFGISVLFQDGGDRLLACWDAFRVASKEESDALPPVERVF